MLTVDDALAQVLTAFEQLPTERIAVADALDRVLASDVQALHDLPPFANSSMDGYAVRAEDVLTASSEKPVRLKVVADIPAGTFVDTIIGQGQAARIMTGAPMPSGADAVVPVEQTNDQPHGYRYADHAANPPSEIAILRAVQRGDYVRLAGEDLKTGQVILRYGRVLRPADLGVLAGLGLMHVEVIRRPIVAILSTGDELLAPDQPLQRGKIRDMNGYTITALAQQLGAQTVFLGIARDKVEHVRTKLQQAIDLHANLIITSAGVSVGTFDVVKDVVESMGSIDFWKVNMRPGKPLAFGRIQGIPILGLPGNPVSAVVSFTIFAKPAIQKMAGRSTDFSTVEAETSDPIDSDGRRTFMRVKLYRRQGKLIASSTGTQSSGALSSLVNADGLLIIPEGMVDIPIGTCLPVHLLTNEIQEQD